jgi:hypothetical protein
MLRGFATKSRDRFMRVVLAYLTSLSCMGVLLGYHAYHLLGGFIGLIWCVFIGTAIVVVLDGARARKELDMRRFTQCAERRLKDCSIRSQTESGSGLRPGA